MKLRDVRGRILAIAGLVLGLAAEARAQLVLDQPNLRWTPGETIELFVPRRDDGQLVRIETVLFDDRPVPFDLLTPRSRDEAIRIRLRVPAGIKPGAHQISADVLETTLAGVPALLGLTLEEAQRALEALGLRLGKGSSPSELRATRVVQQRPIAGARVRPGTAINVTTATEVPDIADLSLEEARLRLEPRGLELDTALIVDVPAPAEGLLVVRYTPTSGTTVVTGTRVQVQDVAVEVPELAGRRIDVARQILLDSGFVPLVTLHAPKDGPYETILAQQPAANLPAPPATEVRLTVESRLDPPDPRWPLPELAVVVALTLALRRLRKRQRPPRRKYQIEGHTDIDRLREQSKSPDLENRELGLDLRLLGFTDTGHQTLNVDGSLIMQGTSQ